MAYISTHTLRGERDLNKTKQTYQFNISTHTLRGERDAEVFARMEQDVISTHTLRGERDEKTKTSTKNNENFNSHAPRGA